MEHYDLSAAQETFGFDQASTVIVSSDPTDVFQDPAAGDYALSVGLCPGAGYPALP